MGNCGYHDLSGIEIKPTLKVDSSSLERSRSDIASGKIEADSPASKERSLDCNAYIKVLRFCMGGSCLWCKSVHDLCKYHKSGCPNLCDHFYSGIRMEIQRSADCGHTDRVRGFIMEIRTRNITVCYLCRTSRENARLTRKAKPKSINPLMQMPINDECIVFIPEDQPFGT